MGEDKSVLFSFAMWVGIGYAIYKGSYWLLQNQSCSNFLTAAWGIGGLFSLDYWQNLYDNVFGKKNDED